MDYDSYDDLGSEISEETESVEGNVEVETIADKGTELVTPSETSSAQKSSELMES